MFQDVGIMLCVSQLHPLCSLFTCYVILLLSQKVAHICSWEMFSAYFTSVEIWGVQLYCQEAIKCLFHFILSLTFRSRLAVFLLIWFSQKPCASPVTFIRAIATKQQFKPFSNLDPCWHTEGQCLSILEVLLFGWEYLWVIALSSLKDL